MTSAASLTLIALLNFVGTNFCDNRESGMSTLKSVLLAYSKANDRFGGSQVRRVISESTGIEVAAVAVVATKCPHLL